MNNNKLNAILIIGITIIIVAYVATIIMAIELGGG